MLLRAIFFVLRPFVRLVALFPSSLLTPKLPKPTDAPHAHASGPDPDRVLLYGSGPSVGYGVLSNDIALPGQLARTLSAVTGRGVDVDVTAHSDVMAHIALAELRGLDLWRYDAIVLTIGVRDALVLTPLRKWRAALTELFAYLDSELPVHTKIFVIAVPPLQETGVFARNVVWFADQHGMQLNRAMRRATSGFKRITYVPFSPLAPMDSTTYQNASIYQHWARIIVAPLGAQLAELDRDHVRRSLSAGEEARQDALDALNILDTEAEERFDRIARLACQMLGMPSATIGFVDHDRFWMKSRVNFPVSEIPRGVGTSGYLPRTRSALVINDLSKDPALSQNSLVTGSAHLRFYAGYPIESPYGEPIGVVAVYGTAPRTWTDVETSLLRDLAILVQRELGHE